MEKEKIITDKLLDKIKEKGIFSEYLPENFNLKSDKINIYGIGATYKDKIEPYSYYMSRLGKKGDRRMISIPELSTYVSLVNFLRDNRSILFDIIQLSGDDYNSFSRIANEEHEIVDDDGNYGQVIKSINFSISEEGDNQEEEKERSVYVENILEKIKRTQGACGILHLDISEFYKSIYTHMLSVIKLGVDGAEKAYQENSQDADYKKYVAFDDRIRRLNSSRTNGILVGPYISRVVSEAILARVDTELREMDYNFVRYADDYEIAVYKEDELEDIKSKIVSVFARYDFRINNEKTKYEKYPFYMFKNYEKVLESLAGKDKVLNSVEIVELFNKFLNMEKNGEKGAIRYLLKTYKNEYHIEDEHKELYASYLLNVLCNDEKSLGLACKIIIYEYKEKRIELDHNFYKVILDKLEYEIKMKHDLEIVWLTYLLKYTDYLEHPMLTHIIDLIIESDCDLAIIIIMEECSNIIEDTQVEKCWNNCSSWILLYQIALRYPDKREEFFSRIGIGHNKNFYKKLFENNFTFYKNEANW